MWKLTNYCIEFCLRCTVCNGVDDPWKDIQNAELKVRANKFPSRFTGWERGGSIIGIRKIIGYRPRLDFGEFLHKWGVKERKSPREGEILLLPSGHRGRRPLEAQERVSRFAKRDLRLCLKNPQVFEKTWLKLLSFQCNRKFPSNARKFTLTSPIGRTLTCAKRNINSAQADINSGFARH